MNLIFWRRVRREQEPEQGPHAPTVHQQLEGDESRADAVSVATRNGGLSKEVWGLGWTERLIQDLRYGLRILLKNLVHAMISVFTLALGIGASTAIFSVVYGVLLHSLPYDKPEQIVRMWELDSDGRQKAFADPNFEDIRAGAHSLQGMAEYYSDDTTVTVGDQPDRIQIGIVSEDFFSVMGVKAVQGRLFSPGEQHFGAAQTAVVSCSFWRQYLHGTSDLGAVKLTVARIPTTVIGVLPQGFYFPEGSQIWLPRETLVRLPSRSAHNWRVVARLQDGVPLSTARGEVTTLAQRIWRQYGPQDITMVDASLLPLREALTTDIKPALLLLLGVAGLLLLVACANVMNLSLAQASAREGELAVRAALGASRWRLVRQFLAEAFLLCFLGGLLGVLAAGFGVKVLLALAPPGTPRLDEVSVNLPVLLFALGLSVLVAGGLGTFTALRATSGETRTRLAEGGRGQGSGVRSQRTGRMIVAGQIAITLTLLVGAGLLGRSMFRVLSIYPGFQTEHIATLDLKLPDLPDGMESQRSQLLEKLISRLQAVPGVLAVGGTSTLPLESPHALDGAFAVVNPQQLPQAQRELIEHTGQVSFEKGDPILLRELTKFLGDLFNNPTITGDADFVVASEGYFQCVGIPLLRGRLFNDHDTPDQPQVAVITSSVADQKWKGQDPIGQTIEFGSMDGDLRLLTIVGIVGEVRTRRLEVEPRPTVYVDYRQRPRKTSDFTIVVRTRSDPEDIFTSARRILSELDPTVPPRFSTFTQVFSASLNGRRFNLLLVGVFAGAALLLAVAGIFGVLAYSVARRTRELGVRIALGASTGNVLGLVLKQALITAVIGVAIGLAASVMLTRTMRSLLFDVSPVDPVTLVGVTLLVLLVALLASYIPARRATRVDPIVALRYE